MDFPLDKQFEDRIDLIEGALSEFAHLECPYCGSYVGMNKYIDDGDIRRWLINRKVKKKE